MYVLIHYPRSCESLKIRVMSSSSTSSHKEPLPGSTHSDWWFTKNGYLTQNQHDPYKMAIWLRTNMIYTKWLPDSEPTWSIQNGPLTQNQHDLYHPLWTFQGSRDHVSLTLAYSQVPDTSNMLHKYWLRKARRQLECKIPKRKKKSKCFSEAKCVAK